MTDSPRENKSPKWDPHSRVDIYLDHSPNHLGSVVLVLISTTLFISPQYHVVFDHHFTTVPSMRNGSIPKNWLELVKESDDIKLEDGNDLVKI